MIRLFKNFFVKLYVYLEWLNGKKRFILFYLCICIDILELRIKFFLFIVFYIDIFVDDYKILKYDK